MTIAELREICERLEAEGKGGYSVGYRQWRVEVGGYEWEEIEDSSVDDGGLQVELSW